MILKIREVVYEWISRGLFERHKVIFLSMVTFRLIQRSIIPVEYKQDEMNYILNCVPKPGKVNPLKDWLP